MKKLKYLISSILCLSTFLICSCGKQSNFDKAVLYQNDGEYNRAIKFYKIAIKEKDHSDVAEKNLGDIYFSKNKYDEAFKHYKNSIEINADVAIDKVMQFISYRDEYIRDLTSQILSNLGNDDSKNKMFEILSSALKSNEQYKTLDALDFISKLNDFAPIAGDILALLDGDDIVVKQKVLTIIPRVADIVLEEGYLDKIISLLNQENELLKSLAIDCLGNMFGASQNAFPILIQIIVEEPNFRQQALEAIDKIGLPNKEQFVQISEYIGNKPSEIKIEILERIGAREQGSNFLVPYIISFLDDGDDEVKQVTRKVLSKIGRADTSVVPELIDLLQRNNDEIVSRAIYELGDLGNASSQAIEPLKQIAEDGNRNKDLRDLAQNALQKIQK